ncbi:MAG: LacI family DNA-binding transcriptional regulator [Cyclobacteriaceae bacterium]|nr:LacI family DNA-binding transcriptional regulator [Cyclobacteriaceae bacterium]
MKKSQITLADMAKELNISVSTVSRALRNHPAISAETKALVRQLAERWQYEPNQLALSLLHKKTFSIGVVVPEITGYFFATAITAIQDMVAAAGYKLIIIPTDESENQEVRAFQTLMSIRVDGIIFSPSSQTRSYHHFEKAVGNGIPLVMFDRECEGFDSDKVLVDDYNGAWQATEYLIKTGCRRIAHIGGPPGLSISHHRKHGYLQAMRDHGLDVDACLLVESEGFTSDHGREIARDLMNLTNVPDAIFAFNDPLAIGAMSWIQDVGRRVPEDISIVGFDDEPYSAFIRPSLSTVWQPVYDMGMLAAKILLDRLQVGESLPSFRREILKPELVVRGSSKAL